MGLGYFLYDDEEVEAVARVISAVDRLLNTHGTEQSDAFYLSQPEWEAVASSAQRAYELIRRRG